MTSPIDLSKLKTADWRKTLRQNQRRTYIVITLFFIIYCGIGLLVDIYLYSSAYPYADLGQIFTALLRLQLYPFATVIMLAIAVISLLIAYALADKLMMLGTEYHEIKPDSAHTQEEQQLYNIIEEMKIAAGLRYMPRVFIIDADYMNAFASGYSERSAMVAITRGLMQKLNRDEIQAVMAHELSHIRHLDIKLTLTASLLANMTLIVLDFLFYNAVFSNHRNNDQRSKNTLTSIIILLRYLLPLINVLLLLYLSRSRELMADAGAVELTRSNQPLASALIKIHGDHLGHQGQYNKAYRNTPHEHIRRQAYLYDPAEAGIKGISSLGDFFSTHPSLETRLKALGFKKN
jgi:heat shock protein HtpX